jgi:hypothetical protein
MRWKKMLSGHLLASLLALGLIAAGDDVEVVSSPRWVLSIYSYGAGQRYKIAPELPDRSNLHRKSTAPLTDVDVTPALSQSLPAPQSAPTPNALATSADPSGSTTGGTSYSTRSISSDSGSSLPTVVLGWDPSPDESVAGYMLYAGSSSHQYTTKQPIGNQTLVRVVIDQPVLYFAVTAYTNDGLESVLSYELAVTSNGVVVNTSPNTSQQSSSSSSF